MKKLVMITGPAGIGKTTVCQKLFRSIDSCAWLDGDWCWMVNPYPGKTDEQKRYAEKAFGYILDGYFHDERTNTIFFSWLIRADFMFELVSSQISYRNYELIKIVLVCEEKEFIRRLTEGKRSADKISHPDDMEQYRSLNARVIDTTHLSAEETAERILSLLG